MAYALATISRVLTAAHKNVLVLGGAKGMPPYGCTIVSPIRMVVPAAACAPNRTALYRRRQPERTVVYRTVQAHRATWLEFSSDSRHGSSVPAYVERKLRRYHECGILGHDFARARCGECSEGLGNARMGTARPTRSERAAGKLHMRGSRSQ